MDQRAGTGHRHSERIRVEGHRNYLLLSCTVRVPHVSAVPRHPRGFPGCVITSLKGSRNLTAKTGFPGTVPSSTPRTCSRFRKRKTKKGRDEEKGDRPSVHLLLSHSESSLGSFRTSDFPPLSGFCRKYLTLRNPLVLNNRCQR